MSSTQYIKIFNDTVLKQSILQGYETQRTNSELGKFTMGELAFTRDTGRVFVGTYTDNIKSSDIPYVIDDVPNPGGLLVGNKYYGASNDGKKLTHYPSYNSKYGVYNGDYTFDKSTSSLILFDNTITKSNNVTDDIYDDGFIRMKILEPDGSTIMYDSSKTSHNVLKADFKFERVSKYFGDDWTVDNKNEKIEIKNINLSNSAICKLPSTVNFNSTEITFNGEEDFQTKFPSYLLCGEKTVENKFNVSFKKFTDVIKIEGGDGIVVDYTSLDDYNRPQIKISLDDTTQNPNPNPNPNPDDNPPTSTHPEATQTPWDLSDEYFYSGVSRFASNGTLVATETYGNTKIVENLKANNGDNVEFEYDVNKSNKETEAEEKANLDFIKDNYIGGLFNIGLNYLKTPLTSFYINPTTVKNFSDLSGQETCIQKIFSKDSYTYTNDKNEIVNSDYYPRIIPSHAKSIIFQITGKGSKATFKCNDLTILNQTIVNNDVTTVEVPLYVKMIWVKEEGQTIPQYESYKYFNITSSNCTVKLLGYRV